jgi:hypothetical protein
MNVPPSEILEEDKRNISEQQHQAKIEKKLNRGVNNPSLSLIRQQPSSKKSSKSRVLV